MNMVGVGCPLSWQSRYCSLRLCAERQRTQCTSALPRYPPELDLSFRSRMSEGAAGEGCSELKTPTGTRLRYSPFLLCSKSLICLSPFNKILLVIIIK